MNKRRCVYKALMALIAAGALLAAGCKQAEQGGQGSGAGQGSGQASGQGSGAGSGSGTGQGQGQGGGSGTTSKTEVFTNALQFEGIIGESDSQETDKRIKTNYTVSVTISHNRVGVSAEDKYAGFLYMGSAVYEEKTGSVDVVLTNVKNAEDTLSFGATYQKASNVLKVTEFGGEERSAILPLKTEKTVDDRVRTYTVPAHLPVLGESVLVFKISGDQATVAVVTGKGGAGVTNPFGSYGTLGSYHTAVLVGRGKLIAKIPLDTSDSDKAKSILEITATVTKTGVQDVTSSILSLKTKDGQFDEHDSDHLRATELPHFSPALFTFKNTSGGNTTYYGLHLEAMPVVRYQIERGKREKRETYEMKAQFVKFAAKPTASTPLPSALTDRSKEVRVLATLESGAYGDKYNPPVFSFTFPAGCFANTAVDRLANKGSAADAIGFTITNWKPIAGEDRILRDEDGYPVAIPETVEAGNFMLKVANSTGLLETGVALGAITNLSAPNDEYNTAALTGATLVAGTEPVHKLFAPWQQFKRK